MLYPVIGGWSVTSEVPSWFGRYSSFLLIFNLLGIGLIILCCIMWWLGRPLLGLFGCIVLSFAPFGNNCLSGLPIISLTMWAVRFLAGVALVWSAFEAHLQSRKSPANLFSGSFLLLLCLSDFGLFWVTASRQVNAGSLQPYRYAYDLGKVQQADYVLVGDSFVWGQGVAEGYEFGAVVERKLEGHRRVYMLGQIGTGLTRYAQSIEGIPPGCKAKRVVVCFYHNDFPAPERVVDRIQMFGVAIGRGVPSLRFAGDMVAKIATPTPDAYLQRLATNYSPLNIGHEQRLTQLRAELQWCYNAALVHSIERPGLMILPGLLDFNDNRFGPGHELVDRVASDVGFEVYDSLQAFRQHGIPAIDLWADSNDCHFNEEGHKIAAAFLLSVLEPNKKSEKK
jgi:hypothetical protein